MNSWGKVKSGKHEKWETWKAEKKILYMDSVIYIKPPIYISVLFSKTAGLFFGCYWKNSFARLFFNGLKGGCYVVLYFAVCVDYMVLHGRLIVLYICNKNSYLKIKYNY